jgi:hypothetical protein
MLRLFVTFSLGNRLSHSAGIPRLDKLCWELRVVDIEEFAPTDCFAYVAKNL